MSSMDTWRQVLATPNDVHMRAAYIAALVQEGDRRAEPFLVGTELDRKSTEALAKHYEQLTRVAAEEFADAVERWSAKLKFVAGWPSELTIKSTDFVVHAAEIAATIPVRHLNLLAVNDAPEVFSVVQFNQIVSVQASGQVWANRAIRGLTESPYLGALRWLNLSKTGLGDKQIEMLAAARNLRGLAQIDLTLNQGRDPVDAAAGAGYDDGGIVIESIYLPPFGKELEDKYGKIPWLNVLFNYATFPINRYRF